jgi:hypothetical protein
LETEERRVLSMESVSEGGRSWVLISFEGWVSSSNPDAKDGCKYKSVTVSYLEYNYPKYTRERRFNWDKQILVEQNKAFEQGSGRK